MHLDNTYTAESYRFALPDYGDVEHHESFDPTGTPTVEVVAGEESYVTTTDATGETIVHEVMGHHANVPSGSIVKKIATVERNQVPRPRSLGDASFLNEPVGGYEVGENDLLVVEADVFGLHRGSKILETAGRDGIMIVPANQPLPFSNGEGVIGDGRSLDYTIVGAITPELKFISWPGTYFGGRGTQDIIDLCVVNANIRNRLELGLLHDRVGGGSLIGQLDSIPGGQAYLRYFDATRGTNYVPTRDPIHRFVEFPEVLSDADIDLYHRLASLTSIRR
jgi:hypothetical protein